ncbi:hypothetical protein BDN70DRAFT_375431 [Pholiota conissans]|uniref:Uncharacterized protein n=1 Tax=Pholiota conissans TaxID=109636 RepID=A0A9P5YPN4_9AGAR|nr:hypothetical protein BDN70DRAFT_375431 [Pholiota conissans]
MVPFHVAPRLTGKGMESRTVKLIELLTNRLRSPMPSVWRDGLMLRSRSARGRKCEFRQVSAFVCVPILDASLVFLSIWPLLPQTSRCVERVGDSPGPIPLCHAVAHSTGVCTLSA